MECQDGKPRCSKDEHVDLLSEFAFGDQKESGISIDMAAEGTMPGGLMGPRRVPIPQRGAAPPLQHLGKIPESQNTWDPPCDTARSLLSIQALKRAQQNKAERLAWFPSHLSSEASTAKVPRLAQSILGPNGPWAEGGQPTPRGAPATSREKNQSQEN